MKRLFYTLMVVVLTVFSNACFAQKSSQSYYDFETKLIAVEGDGTYTIRAFGRGRNITHAYAQAQKQAVWDVIFKGVEPTTTGIKPLKPLILEVNAEEKYGEYFETFFLDGGEYLNYVSYKERKTGSSRFQKNDVQSTAQVTVSVYRTKLKQKLIEEGILK